MSQQYFLTARRRTEAHLQDAGIEHHMFHGPVSDEYWTAPLRVLAVNMESYGYNDDGHWPVDLEMLRGWMYDVGDTRTRTVRYTMARIRTLLDAYLEGVPPSYEQLQLAYRDEPRLEATLRSSVYYNIRSTANANKIQDVANIIASGTNSLSVFIRDEMLALDPNVILVSGVPSLTAFNAMWQITPPLPFLGRRRLSDHLVVQSMRHPSRPRYVESVSVLSELVQALKQKF